MIYPRSLMGIIYLKAETQTVSTPDLSNSIKKYIIRDISDSLERNS
jgi:hypothetical protein